MQYTAGELAQDKWWASNHDAIIGGNAYDLSLSKNGKVKLVYHKALPGLRTKKVIRYVEPDKKMMLRVH